MTRDKYSIERIDDSKGSGVYDTVKAKFMSGAKEARKLTIPQTTQQNPKTPKPHGVYFWLNLCLLVDAKNVRLTDCDFE